MLINSNQQTLFANPVEMKAAGDSIAIITPYNADFLNDFKNSVPYTSRKWDAIKKVWFISPNYAMVVQTLIVTHYGQTPIIPTVNSKPESFETILTATYVANVAAQTGFANIYIENAWQAKVSENVLKAFFKNYSNDINASYYQLLGVGEQATDLEIKSAYKKTVRQWHPDICREENAAEMFHKIKSAYEILANPEKKSAYDAGLFFEKMSKGRISTKSKPNKYSSYVPMLRCGHLQVKAHYEIGSIIIDEILKWEDITNNKNQIMVTSWSLDKPLILWV